jgi:hypothetical protein
MPSQPPRDMIDPHGVPRTFPAGVLKMLMIYNEGTVSHPRFHFGESSNRLPSEHPLVKCFHTVPAGCQWLVGGKGSKDHLWRHDSHHRANVGRVGRVGRVHETLNHNLRHSVNRSLRPERRRTGGKAD